MSTHQNNMCDGAHCIDSIGEVRLLPLPGGGNLILCMTCYAHEMSWRKERNYELGEEAQFPRPPWATLKLYDPQGEPWETQ